MPPVMGRYPRVRQRRHSLVIPHPWRPPLPPPMALAAAPAGCVATAAVRLKFSYPSRDHPRPGGSQSPRSGNSCASYVGTPPPVAAVLIAASRPHRQHHNHAPKRGETKYWRAHGWDVPASQPMLGFEPRIFASHSCWVQVQRINRYATPARFTSTKKCMIIYCCIY